MDTHETEYLVVGMINAAHGIKGWVKVFSYTDPIEAIIDYAPWQMVKGAQTRDLAIASSRLQGKGLVVLPEGFENRNQAELLIGFEIRVDKTRLPALDQGDYYWYQLEGLAVVNTLAEDLGVVDHLVETGANDVLVVMPTPSSVDDRQRMVPFVEGAVVKTVDLEARQILVEWAADF